MSDQEPRLDRPTLVKLMTRLGRAESENTGLRLSRAEVVAVRRALSRDAMTS